VRVFLTGGTGFVGGVVARRLRERGDEVVALVRSRERARVLAELGCTLVEGGLDRVDVSLLDGCDGVIHSAAAYRVGIPASEVEPMRRTNVDGTAGVVDAATAAGVPRTVYVSTMNTFGNTHGTIVDETYRRGLAEGFLSAYDETKYRAHELVRERIAGGARVLAALPGVVYGPGDTSQLGALSMQAMRGSLRYISFPALGLTACHVADVAEGIVSILYRGRIGEDYCLGGEITTMRGLIDAAAAAAGRRPPRLTIPTGLISAMAPLAPRLGPLLGIAPNLRETIASSDGVTYWATDAKARSELGYAPRSLAEGMSQTFGAGP